MNRFKNFRSVPSTAGDVTEDVESIIWKELNAFASLVIERPSETINLKTKIKILNAFVNSI